MAALPEVHDSTPILVGVGRYTFQRKGRPKEKARFGASPLEMLLKASRRAVADAGLDDGLELNSIQVVSCATDAHVMSAVLNGKSQASLSADERLLYSNPAACVAASLSCPVNSVVELVQTGDSGSVPQCLVNRTFEKIARGELGSAMIVGAEALNSFEAALKQGATSAEVRERWGEHELDAAARHRLEVLKAKPGRTTWPEGKSLEEATRFFSEPWRKHGLGAPPASYAVLANAFRVEEGQTIGEQTEEAARIFAGLSTVASSQREHAWFGQSYSPEELSTETEENRLICHPFYTKRLNSVMSVDMSAALLIMSAAEARRRGIPKDKWIFMQGCSEASDSIDVLERPSLCRAPAAQLAGRRALAMAGVQDVNKDLQFLDVYSCFPVAVQVVCKELGISTENGKALTVTGGLPYHGGPGSNYVTHSVAAMAEQLRTASGNARGLVTANGGYLTKHAYGVYANFPSEAAIRGEWARDDPAATQAEMDKLPREQVSLTPQGTGAIESYCVRYGRKGPELGTVVGKLLDGPDAGKRFVANVGPKGSESALLAFVHGDPVGQRGTVTTAVGGKSVFVLGPAARL